MPRSSIDRCRPSDRSRSSASMARSGSAIRLDSVISRVTASAGTSTAASARATSSTNDGSARLRGEMFTATPIAHPARRHDSHAASDWRSTQ